MHVYSLTPFFRLTQIYDSTKLVLVEEMVGQDLAILVPMSPEAIVSHSSLLFCLERFYLCKLYITALSLKEADIVALRPSTF